MEGQDAAALRGLIHAFIRRFGLLDQTQTPCGMPLPLSQAHALMEVLDVPGITQNELADRLGLSKSNVSRLVAGLLAAGFAQKQRDAKDGRIYRILLTNKGHRSAEELDKRSLARFGALLANLPKRQRGNVIRALDLLAQAVGSGS